MTAALSWVNELARTLTERADWSALSRFQQEQEITQAFLAALVRAGGVERTPEHQALIDSLEGAAVSCESNAACGAITTSVAGLSYMAVLFRSATEALRGAVEPPLEKHWCAGCGYRWEGKSSGLDLCGDCWRQARPVLHVRGVEPPAQEPREEQIAWQNLDRALVHLEDDQLCGIWPDGSSLRGKHIKHMLAELRGARPSPPPATSQEWQPIETAPKDGRPIIAYQPGGTYSNGFKYPANVDIAHWCEADSLNPARWNGPYNPRDYPTHWMPLPVAPHGADTLGPETR